MKVLVVGPSDVRSRGGMATVVAGIRNSKVLNARFTVRIHESYIVSNPVIRLIFSIVAFLKYLFIVSEYDLIHIHMATRGSMLRKMAYTRVAQKANKKVIIHMHGADFPETVEVLSTKRQEKIATFLRGVDMVIGLSDEWKERLEGLYSLENCVSLPNGIDTDEFEQAKSDISETGNCFALLGRMGERKGVFDLIKAMEIAIKINPKIKLFLAGDGEIEKVNSLISEKCLGNSISVVGWVDFSGKIQILKKVSTVVLPSYFEGLPMSVLEGMAAGKAIVSSRVGAIPEVVKEENGIIIEPGDIDALSTALLKLSGNEQLIKNMSECNLKKIDDEFSMKIMHEKLASFYDSLFD